MHLRLLISILAVLCSVAIGLCNSYRVVKLSDFFLARFDSSGNQIWSRSYDFNVEDNVHCVFSKSGDQVILVGFSDCGVNRDGFRIVCVANDGSVLWTHCSRDTYGIESPFCFRGRQLNDGSLLLIGMQWVLCISEDGKKKWSKTTRDAQVRSVTVCPDGGYVLAGSYDDSRNLLNAQTDPSDGAVVKLDSNKVDVWKHNYGRDYWDYFYDATVSANGNICAVGESYPASASGDIRPDGWALILDSNGEIISDRVYGRTIGLRYWDVQNAPDGGFLMLGETGARELKGEVALVFTKIAENGDSLWSRTKGEGWEHGDPVDAFGNPNFPFLEYLQKSARFETSHMIPEQVFVDVICSPYLETAISVDSVKLNGSYFGLTSDGYFLAGTRLLSDSLSR